MRNILDVRNKRALFATEHLIHGPLKILNETAVDLKTSRCKCRLIDGGAALAIKSFDIFICDSIFRLLLLLDYYYS